MTSPETEAQLEGAANLWRFHVRGRVPFWLCVAGLVALGLIGVGFNHLLATSQGHPAQVCTTVASCNRYILTHPIKAPTGTVLLSTRRL